MPGSSGSCRRAAPWDYTRGGSNRREDDSGDNRTNSRDGGGVMGPRDGVTILLVYGNRCTHMSQVCVQVTCDVSRRQKKTDDLQDMDKLLSLLQSQSSDQ